VRPLIAWWAENPVAANLLMIGILLSGLLGFQNVEREAFPLFKDNSVEVNISWPGAAPQEIEEQVLFRAEDALQGIDGIKRIYSFAEEGFGRVEVVTHAMDDISRIVDEVKSAIDSINGFPRDIDKPQIRRQIYRDEIVRIALHGNLTERQLNDLAEDLRSEVAALPYVSIVELFGIRQKEVAIELSEQAMRRYSVTFSEVAAAIRSSSINLSSGRVRTNAGDVLLRARNMAESEADFGAIIIRQLADGGAVRVGDVARIVDGFEDEEIYASINGQPSVLIQVLAMENMQVVKTSEEIKRWMARRQETLPAGVNLTLWFDSADIYKSRMSTIGESAILGLFLVFVVLLLSLRAHIALWVTAGIAVAFLGAFAFLPANDVSLNIFSTFAFLLVLGIVVDDAIVVGESIHQHSNNLGGGLKAAIEGANAVSKPVVYAVLTTIIAFSPWFFLSSTNAQVARQFSIVITLALTVSLIETFLILPSHLRNLQNKAANNIFSKWRQKIELGIIDFANNRYRRTVLLCAQHRYVTVAVFIACFIVSLGLFNNGWVKFNFMPEVENESIYLNVELPAGTHYDRALEVLNQLQRAELELIREVEEAALLNEGSGKIIDGWYTRSRRDSVIAIIKLAPPELRDLTAKQAATRLRQLVGDVPDADNIEINYNLMNNGPRLSYILKHRNMDLLREASLKLQTKLHTFEGTYFVRDNLKGRIDELHLSLVPGAETLGIKLSDVSKQVRQAFYGEEVQRLSRLDGDIKVMIRYPRADRNSLESLKNFRVRTQDGRELPLLSVVNIESTKGVQRIQRRDKSRMVRVSAEVAEELAHDIDTQLNDHFLPELQKLYPELVVGRSGQLEGEANFFNELKALYAIAFFAMYALIAVAFKSYFLPLLVMTAIPFGFMGAVYGHLMFGVPMALFSYFGIGAAAGVVVNDNLVLVDYIGKLRDQGSGPIEAISAATISRFRPIVLTSLTTFVGLMPIMAERSTDAQFLKPAVLSLAFGVVFALFVTLFMVPALYLIGEDIRQKVARLGLLSPWKSLPAKLKT